MLSVEAVRKIEQVFHLDPRCSKHYLSFTGENGSKKVIIKVYPETTKTELQFTEQGLFTGRIELDEIKEIRVTDNLSVTFITKDQALVLTSGLSFLVTNSKEFLIKNDGVPQPNIVLQQLYLN
ncbi:MAG: hypothetical protein ACYDG6_04995 [Thermincolia bacterium]